MNSVFASSDSRDAVPADSTIQAQPRETSRPELSQSVGQASQGSSLTAEQRESAIALAGDLVVKYMDRAYAEGADYFHWRGLADRARLSMEALIKGRDKDWKRQERDTD
jgi:hypothetical protein